MHLRSEALILAVRQHGEHGAIALALTAEHGLQPGYVRGGRSRRIRPILQPANLVLGEWRSRVDDQLAQLTVELVHSRAPLFAEPLPAVALEWVTALTAAALPEAQPYPRLHAALGGVIGAIEAGSAAQDWAIAIALYEMLVLAELGFGLDLDRCAVTGSAEDLVFVSPRSGMAVSRAAGEAHRDRLFPLPMALRGGVAASDVSWPDVFAALAITGHFLARNVLTERRADTLAARDRLTERLKRAVA